MDDMTIYRKLQRHIDALPIPYPATDSGVEISLLKRLFDPTEARVALGVSAIQEPVAKIHARLRHTGLSEDEVREILDGINTRRFLVWTALKEHQQAVAALAECPGTAGREALIGYSAMFFSHLGEGVDDPAVTSGVEVCLGPTAGQAHMR